MRKCFSAVFFVTALWAVPSAWAADPSAPVRVQTSDEILRGDIDRIVAETGDMIVGIRIVALGDASSGAPAEVLYSLRADLPLVPASTMKLLTTAACLDRFGPDWRIRTHVGRLPAAGGGAKWDLAVIGGGDPNFSGRFFGGDAVGVFRQWAKVLKGRGVEAVGRIVLDDTLFDETLQHPNWPSNQRNEWYAVPVSALNLNDNCVDVHIAPGQVGEPALVRLDPPVGYATLEGTILTVADRKDHGYRVDRIVGDGSATMMRIQVGGRYWARMPETIEYRAVVNPTVYFGVALAQTLRAEGIAVAGPIVRERLVDATGRTRREFIADIVHASRLDATAAIANKRSQGLYAECLLKLLGAYGSEPNPRTTLPPVRGSWAAGVEEVRRWLDDRGIPADGCVIDDGSGLSKQNRLTALCVTELLRVMVERHGEAFVRTLAEPGQDGSLRNRMRNTPAEGRVYGKTGYVLGTSALSGYVRTKSGRMAAYSVIMNMVPWGGLWKARQAQDKICLRLVEY